MQRVATSAPRVVFSGIQPTGVPHLGNYAGAVRQWVQLQHQEPSTKLIYSIVDLHAITTPRPPAQLRRAKRELLAALLAVGIDPDRATIFYQSAVPAHSELMWILSCTASVGYLSRMTQWKVWVHGEASRQRCLTDLEQQKLNMSPTANLEDRPVGSRLKLGLFSYPVLQAADILVHRYGLQFDRTRFVEANPKLTSSRATHVPVGPDQLQHLEFARECVTNFNSAYGPQLVHPQTITRAS